VSRSMEREVLSLLSYPGFLLSVFLIPVLYLYYGNFNYVYHIQFSVFYALVVQVSCQYLPSDWLERLH